MSRRTRVGIVSFVLSFVLVMVGCAPQPAATPVPKPTTAPMSAPTAVPQSEATKPTLTVMGKAFTLKDLQALEQVSAEVDGKKYSGVSLQAVLKAADVQVSDIALVGSDGYSANVSVKDITAQCLLAYNANGGVDAVLPGLKKGSWVRDTVEIREGKPSDSSKSGAKPTAEGASNQPAGGPLKLTDAAGRTVDLPKLPQRIVVVGRGPHMTLHLLYMFPEGRERLVGTEKRGATASDFLPFVDPEFANKPTLDANPNAEQVAALEPDLVIMKGIVADALAGALAQADIPVLYVNLETPAEFFRDLANLGAVLGNPKRAEEIASFYQSRLEKLRKGTEGLEDAAKPSVLMLEYSDRGGTVAVQVPAKVWMQTIEVQTAGGNPVWFEAAEATDGWTVVNFEQIAKWDADKIFVIVWYSLDPQKVINDLKADPQWAVLKAVKNGEIYVFPQDIFGWDQPEPRWILGMMWLATRLYPDRFKDIDMNAELMAYFTQLYGMDKANIETNILPKVRMDVR